MPQVDARGFVVENNIEAPAPPARGTGPGSGTPPSLPWQQNPAVSASKVKLLRLYFYGTETVDVKTLTLLPQAGELPASTRALTVEDHVNLVHIMQLTDDKIVYEDKLRRELPRPSDTVLSLIENVANRLKTILILAYEELPWAEDLAKPPDHWYLDCLNPICTSVESLVDLIKLFAFARGWIHYAGALMDVLLLRRDHRTLGSPPMKPCLSTDLVPAHQRLSTAQRWSKEEFQDWQQRNQSPIHPPDFYAFSPKPGVDQTTIQAKSVTIAEPQPHSATELGMLADVAAFRTPARPTIPQMTTGTDRRSFPPPPKGAFYVPNLNAASPKEMSRQLPVLPGSPLKGGQPVGSQYATLATGGGYFASQDATRYLPDSIRSNRVPRAITPGRLSATPHRSFAPPLAPRGLPDYEPVPPPKAATPSAHVGNVSSFRAPEDLGQAPQPSRPMGALPIPRTSPMEGSGGVPPPGPPYGGGYGGRGGGYYPGGRGRNGPPPGGGGGLGGYGQGGAPLPGGGGGGPGYNGGHYGGAPPPGPPPGGGGQHPPGPPGGGFNPAAGREEPRFDSKYKVGNIPLWDGNKRTAIDYFSHLRRWAEVGGLIPFQLGKLAPTRFTKAAMDWWDNISDEWHDYYRQNVYTLIYGIRYAYLSESWGRALVDYFHTMTFRQAKHERETPVEFIKRRAVLCKALWDSDERRKVIQILARTPVGWLAILNEHNIPDVHELFVRATELEQQLTAAVTANSDLKRVVWEQLEEMMGRKSRRQFVRRNVSEEPDRADLKLAPQRAPTQPMGDVAEDEEDNFAHVSLGADGTLTGDFSSVVNLIKVFLADKNKRSSVPKSYPFPRDTRASTNQPLSPCRACGGPHWNSTPSSRKSKGNTSGSAYGSSAHGSNDTDSLFEILRFELVPANGSCPSSLARSPDVRRTSMQEIRDEWFDCLSQQPSRSAESSTGNPSVEVEDLISFSPIGEYQQLDEEGDDCESNGSSEERMVEIPDVFNIWYTSSLKALLGLLESGGDGYFETSPRVILAAAMSAKGASISLIVESYLKRMRHPPKIHMGLKIALAQLIDQSPR
ncbi:hypothetical protein AURDEDRAFT_130752 [Auricularia subglabra TFB-10046 SS5]|nr:hypothetical protein AURDEDRAFT_130752 [Auricularia subglabra TFB-10046 SS5]